LRIAYYSMKIFFTKGYKKLIYDQKIGTAQSWDFWRGGPKRGFGPEITVGLGGWSGSIERRLVLTPIQFVETSHTVLY